MLEIILGRYSVRKFSSRDIPDDMIRAIIEAARWAPSAGNLQPWFFYVVRGREHREALASFARQGFLAQAPVCIVACVDPHRSARIYGQRGEQLYSIQDTAAAVQNMLLAAASLGLGSCWVGAFDEQKVHKYLRMPDYRRPVSILPVGHSAAEGGGRPGRREIEEISQFL